MMVKYSIIVPAYNSAKVIRRCLDSVAVQTCQDYEVLVMDGNSTDDTVAVANAVKSEKIKVFSSPDHGIYDAMNKGIDKSSGEWLMFLGSDDYFYNKEVLEDMERFLTDDYDVVYGDVESHLSERHNGEWSVESLDANRCHQAIFYNRRFFGKSLRYNLKYPVLADFDINLRWFLDNRYTHRYVPIIISHYSSGGYSSRVRDIAFYRDFGLNKLRYNHRVLSPVMKKRAARQYVGANPDSLIIKIVFTVYADFLFVFQKLMK